jgi:hypothetical protein
MPSYLKNADRQILETTILPYFATSQEFTKILFVGTAWYTEGYKQIFQTKNYSTIEIDPSQAKYGSSQHIIDSIAHVHHHFRPNELDLIICNGVFGWGLNAKPEVESTFTECFHCLWPGGVFVLGGNDRPEHRPFPLDELKSLKLFQPWVLPPLATAQYRTTNPNCHTFNFYSR